MKRAGVVVAVLAAVAVIVGIGWYARRPAGTKAPAAIGSAAATGAAGGGEAASGGGAAPGDDEADDGGAGAAPATYRVLDADARLALGRRIRAAREARAAGKPAGAEAAADPGDPPALAGILSPDQVLDGIMPIMPLLKECYAAGLDRRTIKSGQVKFTLDLSGEPAIGTVVDNAKLEGDSEFLADAELSQCLHETIMSLELPPMSEGASVVTVVNMTFSPDGPDDAGDAPGAPPPAAAPGGNRGRGAGNRQRAAGL